ncbi:AMP-binding protein [Rhodococcus sp. 11-3]|uniref:AMP-binding protein n=1 Tax=Rhodococcus sp. 11-3 TaxID=2854796 RepID=UPI0020415D15|nr:AMP-binding protein [Rhodococcus sp. 11-3]USC16330.1 AMP-binding protein [Rhodococcus sp. 11-3]
MNTRLSHTVGPAEQPLLEMTIGDNFDRTVARFPDREALVDVPTGRRWTYADLRADVDALARALLEEGITLGDRVGIWAPNCAEWTIVQFATAKVGAILVTVNPAYRAHELEYVLTQSGIRLMFAVPSFKTSDYAAMIVQVSPRCRSLEKVVHLGGEEWAALLRRGAQASPDRLAEVQDGLTPDDPINIQYTSGTTGFPKGATLSHRNILNNGFFVGELLGYTEQDRICVPVPFYHCFGMVMGNLGASTHGACVVIPAPAFDPVATLRACAEERCTSLYGVPTMFISLLDAPGFDSYDLSSIRTGAMAGSPCPVEVMKQVTQWAPEMAIAYGMTETSPASAQTRANDSLDRRVSTVGRAHPHVELEIVDPATGETVPSGQPGELCVRGYSVMLGYWNQPDKTAETVDADGWIHTGDLAVMDEAGFVAITGRIKDMVIRGGENIHPREIEEFFYTHPDVLDAQVIGVPDAKYGEELMVWLRLRDGAAPWDAAALREFCRGRLAHYKIPRYVHCVDQFPMTVTGKIRKVEMREHAIDMLGLEA